MRNPVSGPKPESDNFIRHFTSNFLRGPTGYILLVTNTYEIISRVHVRRHVQVRSA